MPSAEMGLRAATLACLLLAALPAAFGQSGLQLHFHFVMAHTVELQTFTALPA